ncbi:MAG TPA: O-antigen ligase family protein [Candidatus Sulfotelmatobacter sp.]
MPDLPCGAWAHSRDWGMGECVTKTVLLPLQFLFSAPSFLFLATLTAMLMRHPDVQFYRIDRVAFGLLLIAVAGRTVLLRQNLCVFQRASWPMLGLTLFALATVVGKPFDQDAWSLLASKLLVPFAMFHIAGLIFTSEARLRHFEIFCLVVLAYLTFTAIAFLSGAHALIFPGFILNADLGIHADRARGPLLQAVANGVSLNVLGLVALHSYMRGKMRGPALAVLLAAVPIAILATLTRAVWLSFAGALVAVAILFWRCRCRRVLLAIQIVAAAALALLFSSEQLRSTLNDRLNEEGPIEFRQAVYNGAWDMFLERPLLGWGFHRMPDELPRHVAGYQEKILYPHNTYLELLAEQGALGFGLYAWLMWELWSLRRTVIPEHERHGLLNQNFHRLWPIILGVYWLNAAVVVMSYQFVNALIFSMAGMLVAQRRRIALEFPC